MGCDIHVYCEARHKHWEGNSDKWFNIDHWKKNKYSSMDEGEKEWEVVNIYDNRDYALFSILAGVRNYYGNTPIDEPRGLPNDCSKEVASESELWGGDGHSHSWLTLKELMDYKRDHSKTKYSGFITNEQATELENGITPDSWCQGTNMSGYVHREWEDEIAPSFTSLLDSLIDRACDEFWIYNNDSKSQSVKKIAEDVRIVFWFDN